MVNVLVGASWGYQYMFNEAKAFDLGYTAYWDTSLVTDMDWTQPCPAHFSSEGGSKQGTLHSRCPSCDYGYFADGPQSCGECTNEVPHCAKLLECTETQDTTCAQCDYGYFKFADGPQSCAECTNEIPHCAKLLECTQTQDSTCAQCDG